MRPNGKRGQSKEKKNQQEEIAKHNDLEQRKNCKEFAKFCDDPACIDSQTFRSYLSCLWTVDVMELEQGHGFRC